jgi:hypothetical protein
MPTVASSDIRQLPGPKDWGAVWFLIHELETTRTEHWLPSIYRWELTVRLFRAIEQHWLIENEPDQTNLEVHRQVLSTLIDVGRRPTFSDQTNLGTGTGLGQIRQRQIKPLCLCPRS